MRLRFWGIGAASVGRARETGSPCVVQAVSVVWGGGVEALREERRGL
jgi:hypothetical protein